MVESIKKFRIDVGDSKMALIGKEPWENEYFWMTKVN